MCSVCRWHGEGKTVGQRGEGKRERKRQGKKGEGKREGQKGGRGRRERGGGRGRREWGGGRSRRAGEEGGAGEAVHTVVTRACRNTVSCMARCAVVQASRALCTAACTPGGGGKGRVGVTWVGIPGVGGIGRQS